MTIHDVSLPITASLVVWQDDPPVSLTYIAHQDDGEVATLSRVEMGLHTGTHVDAPKHFIRGGAGIDSLDLNMLVGRAVVVELMDVEIITADVLESLDIPEGTERLLVHTRNSELWEQGHREFFTDYVAFDRSGARWLVDHGVRLIGVDYLSVASFQDLVVTHEVLLDAAVIVVEGLNLTGISPGAYQFVCLPLLFSDRDGSPARAILIDSVD
ncbi:MAG: cyclase family protein [Chloroflexota bacterium]|nr:cyclase family protein [Chloroflexota bacterium]